MVPVLLLALLAGADARQFSGNPPPKSMPVPCYMKIYNGFCYKESDKGWCTFYSSPSFADAASCLKDTNMGKTLKCSEVPGDLKSSFAKAFATCIDGGSAGGAAAAKPAAAAPAWTSAANSDIAGKDIPSGGKGFTQVCGSADAVKAACAKVAACKAFTHDGKCGYLKTDGAATKGRQGWTVFAIKK